MPDAQIILRWNTKCISHPVEEREQRRDVDSLSNLIFTPARVAQLLHVASRGLIRPMSDDFHVIKQGSLRRAQSSVV